MPAAEAATQAANRHDQVRNALMRGLEAARYSADRAFRQHDAADPENRLVAAELEARWNLALAHVGEIESKIAAHDAATPEPLRFAQRVEEISTSRRSSRKRALKHST